MNNFLNIFLLGLSIYIARWIYLSQTSQVYHLNEKDLFEHKALGAVKEYPVNERIELVSEGNQYVCLNLHKPVYKCIL